MSPLPTFDLYKVLGVPDDASLVQIRSAYRKLVLRCHPDKVLDASLKPAKEEEFRKVQEAYEILSDYDLRKSYNILLCRIGLRRYLPNEYSTERCNDSEPDANTAAQRENWKSNSGFDQRRPSGDDQRRPSGDDHKAHNRKSSEETFAQREREKKNKERKERDKKEKIERERLEKEREKKERVKKERERMVREKIEKERRDRERRDMERREKERKEIERRENERKEIEKEKRQKEKDKEKRERQRKQGADQKRSGRTYTYIEGYSDEDYLPTRSAEKQSRNHNKKVPMNEKRPEHYNSTHVHQNSSRTKIFVPVAPVAPVSPVAPVTSNLPKAPDVAAYARSFQARYGPHYAKVAETYIHGDNSAHPTNFGAGRCLKSKAIPTPSFFPPYAYAQPSNICHERSGTTYTYHPAYYNTYSASVPYCCPIPSLTSSQPLGQEHLNFSKKLRIEDLLYSNPLPYSTYSP